MSEFYVVCGLLLLLALFFLWSPLMMHRSASVSSRSGVNVQLYEQRLAELENEHQRGDLTAEEFERLKTELQRRLLDEASDEGVSTSAGGKPSLIVVAVMIVVVAFAAGFIYLQTGAKADWEILQVMTEVRQQSKDGKADDQNVSQLLGQLNDRLQQRPDNSSYWMLLANTEMELGNYSAASEAYHRLEQLFPEDAGVLAQYAQALYLASDRQLTPQVNQAAQRALMINPQQSTVLSLLGIASFEQGEYKSAISYWQRLLPQLGPFSPNRKMIQAGIDEAKALLVKSGGVLDESISAEAVDKKIIASIEVHVSLDQQIEVDKNAAVFVFARAVGGPRMPLAVARLRAVDLPTTITLDDSMAMAPGLQLSNFPTVEVVARISKNGIANPGPGDIEGLITPVDVAETNTVLRLIINRVLD